MTRPTLEVADILRTHGDRFLDRYRSSFGFQHLKAFRAILRCRTAGKTGTKRCLLPFPVITSISPRGASARLSLSASESRRPQP